MITSQTSNNSIQLKIYSAYASLKNRLISPDCPRVISAILFLSYVLPPIPFQCATIDNIFCQFHPSIPSLHKEHGIDPPSPALALQSAQLLIQSRRGDFS